MLGAGAAGVDAAVGAGAAGVDAAVGAGEVSVEGVGELVSLPPKQPVTARKASRTTAMWRFTTRF